jgi:hypothetical protein
MLAKIALGFVITVGLGTAYLLQDGLIRVSVEEYRKDGTNLHLYVPAEVAPLAAHFLPREEFRGNMKDLREVLPILRAMSAELTKLPDTVLVEVRDGDEHVRVAKSGGGLEVEEESPREHVHVYVPLRALYDTAEVLQGRLEANPN